MDENSGQAPRKTPGGAKGIDWLQGEALYARGMSASQIARELGCRRELVARKVSRWKGTRAAVHEAATTALAEQAVESNLVILTKIDRTAALALETTHGMLEYYRDVWRRTPKKFDPYKYRAMIAAFNDASGVQRACRGLAKDAGLEPDRDRDLRVVVDIMPATRAEYDAMKNVTPEAVPA